MHAVCCPHAAAALSLPRPAPTGSLPAWQRAPRLTAQCAPKPHLRLGIPLPAELPRQQLRASLTPAPPAARAVLRCAARRDLDGGIIRVNHARGPPTFPPGGRRSFDGGPPRGRCARGPFVARVLTPGSNSLNDKATPAASAPLARPTQQPMPGSLKSTPAGLPCCAPGTPALCSPPWRAPTSLMPMPLAVHPSAGGATMEARGAATTEEATAAGTGRDL